EQNVCP
ncbi:Hypothetical protein NocV09_04700100, partial [Nannochloropsis oceanica]